MRNSAERERLAHTEGHWYMVGHCRLRDGIRWFRLERVISAHCTAEPAKDISVEVVGTPPSTAEPVTADSDLRKDS